MGSETWEFLIDLASDSLDKKLAGRASSFIVQAFDFFQAAQNPQIGSKPLLYYYSFLNLAKTALLVSGVALPERVRHGIREDTKNSRDRSRFEGHKLIIDRAKPTHSEIFAEFARLFGLNLTSNKSIRVIDALSQVPSVHRTFARIRKQPEILLPIKDLNVYSDGTELWTRLVVEARHAKSKDNIVEGLKRIPFRRWFSRVESGNDKEVWYDSINVQRSGRWFKTASAELHKTIWPSAGSARIPFSAILTPDGYRYYIWNEGPSKYLHPLVATFAVMFYLGSITRYRPYAFDSALEGGSAWVVWEFMATGAAQFLYTLASHLAETEVVRPYADIRV
jgi:hypothetical protein